MMIESATEHAFYAPDSGRAIPALRWPGGAPLALAWVVSAEHYDLYPPARAFTPANVPGGFGRGPYPDYRAFSMREYGNRVGVFRLIDLLSHAGLRATLAADASVVQTRPEVLKAAIAAGWDLAGHGLSVTDVISEHMSPDEERAYLAGSLGPLQALASRPILGWHGAEYAESSRTPLLLAERGVQYLLDWPHDERVVPFETPAGTILSLPMSADLDDVMAHWHRKISMARWVRSVMEAVARLCQPGQGGGRLLILNIHPWLMGQPYRSSHLAGLLRELRHRDDVWFTTTDAIAREAKRQFTLACQT